MALIFDLETDGLLDEGTKIHCLVIKDLDTGQVRSYTDQSDDAFENGLDRLYAADCIIGHNIIKFDIPFIQKLYPNWRPKGEVRDTLVCTRLVWAHIGDFDFAGKYPDLPTQLRGRHSLKAWGYRMGIHKGAFGETTDWKEFTPEMLAYCVQDVEVTATLWAKIQAEQYSEKAIELEHQFCTVIQKQERHGFKFDREACVKLYSQLGQRRAELEKELKTVFPGWYSVMKKAEGYQVALQGHLEDYKTKALAVKAARALEKEQGFAKGALEVFPIPMVKHIEFNPSSRDHIAKALIEMHGWKPEKHGADGKPTIDDVVLSELVYPEAKLLREYFDTNKLIGQLAEGPQAWLKAEKKGRIHGEVNTNGAVTGRCTHQRPNLAQVPGVKKGKIDGVEQILYGASGGFGAECRSLFGVPHGRLLVGADASGLELRCLAHFLARYDAGAYARVLLTGDIHTANQQAAGLPTRNNAKTFIYAFLYGAGDAKIGSIVGGSARDGGVLRKQFLARTPGLKRFREDVLAASRRGYLVGLDGRHIHVRSEHSALNALLQSAGALIVKQATVNLYEDLTAQGLTFGKEWALVAHIHDEMQIETNTEIASHVGERAVAAMRAAGDVFGFRCPIDGEYHIGGNWKETH